MSRSIALITLCALACVVLVSAKPKPDPVPFTLAEWAEQKQWLDNLIVSNADSPKKVMKVLDKNMDKLNPDDDEDWKRYQLLTAFQNVAVYGEDRCRQAEIKRIVSLYHLYDDELARGDSTNQVVIDYLNEHINNQLADCVGLWETQLLNRGRGLSYEVRDRMDRFLADIFNYIRDPSGKSKQSLMYKREELEQLTEDKIAGGVGAYMKHKGGFFGSISLAFKKRDPKQFEHELEKTMSDVCGPVLDELNEYPDLFDIAFDKGFGDSYAKSLVSDSWQWLMSARVCRWVKNINVQKAAREELLKSWL